MDLKQMYSKPTSLTYLTAIDYTPPAIEGESALTAASLATLRLKAEKQRNEEIHMLKLSMPKFFASLWESIVGN